MFNFVLHCVRPLWNRPTKKLQNKHIPKTGSKASLHSHHEVVKLTTPSLSGLVPLNMIIANPVKGKENSFVSMN